MEDAGTRTDADRGGGHDKKHGTSRGAIHVDESSMEGHGSKTRSRALLGTGIVVIILLAIVDRLFVGNVIGTREKHDSNLAVNLATGIMPVLESKSIEGPIEILDRPGYVLAHSGCHKIPLWVAERVDTERLAGSAIISFASRIFDEFHPDPALNEPKAQVKDYASDKRFDPGHLAAAGNILNKDPAFKKMRKETFYLSNCAPMVKAFNRGVWRRLESHVRELGKAHGEIWVISGSIFYPNQPFESIGDHVSVPTHFWKIVTMKDAETGALTVTAFLLEHEESNKEISSFGVPLDRIKELTGWNFFPKSG
jgi:DNA/RNA endonuclease G (NUC1)